MRNIALKYAIAIFIAFNGSACFAQDQAPFNLSKLSDQMYRIGPKSLQESAILVIDAWHVSDKICQGLWIEYSDPRHRGQREVDSFEIIMSEVMTEESRCPKYPEGNWVPVSSDIDGETFLDILNYYRTIQSLHNSGKLAELKIDNNQELLQRFTDSSGEDLNLYSIETDVRAQQYILTIGNRPAGESGEIFNFRFSFEGSLKEVEDIFQKQKM